MNAQVIIIGAGVGGLSCAYKLLQNGVDVIIIERENEVGGLLRSVKFKDFSVDYGYKNLDDGIPEVHVFWKELLKEDYLPIELRTGILYNGNILELEKSHKGLLRGIPLSLLIKCGTNLFWSKIRYTKSKNTSLANYTYERRGELFTKIFTQEYSERSRGNFWGAIPAPTIERKNSRFFGFFKDASKVRLKRGDSFHPSKGTGQIIDKLKCEIEQMGGKIYLDSQVTAIDQENAVVKSLSVIHNGKKLDFKAAKFVSSLPIPIASALVGIELIPQKSELSFRRGVIMVYIFLDTPISFPHNNLRVSCPKATCSRITNYSAFGEKMVPKGKGCLCVEYFLPHSQHILGLSDEAIKKLTIKECEESNVIEKESYTDLLIIRDFTADPAQSWEDYVFDSSRGQIYSQLSRYVNFYQINRTGADKSTYAGLRAAESILSEDKERFMNLTKPEEDKPWKNEG